tara:strand:- start:117 stop:383 length:267 start_codon:yes stop_codon:yes gene_type:complete
MSTKTKTQKQPKWFQGQIYSEGGEVRNPFSGETYELNALELSLYDLIIGSQMMFGSLPYADEVLVKDFEKALKWFRINNPEAYMVLLD